MMEQRNACGGEKRRWDGGRRRGRYFERERATLSLLLLLLLLLLLRICQRAILC
jgi:hypothetical protein